MARTDAKREMLLLNRAELAHKVTNLRDGFGGVALFVFVVDALGRLVENRSNNGKVTITNVGKQRIARIERDLAALFVAGDGRLKIHMGWHAKKGE